MHKIFDAHITNLLGIMITIVPTYVYGHKFHTVLLPKIIFFLVSMCII